MIRAKKRQETSLHHLEQQSRHREDGGVVVVANHKLPERAAGGKVWQHGGHHLIKQRLPQILEAPETGHQEPYTFPDRLQTINLLLQRKLL